MACKNHYKKPLGTIEKCDCDCPKRPRPDKHVLMVFENCAPFAGNKYTPYNTIFDTQPDFLPVTMAATIENFSTEWINVTIYRKGAEPVVIPVQGKSSLTFVYDKVLRITLSSCEEYTGSFKHQITYEVEKD